MPPNRVSANPTMGGTSSPTDDDESDEAIDRIPDNEDGNPDKIGPPHRRRTCALALWREDCIRTIKLVRQQLSQFCLVYPHPVASDEQ